MSFAALKRIVPGVGLAAAVGFASVLIARVEERLFGHAVIEGLVVAILLGMVIRTLWEPPEQLDAGVRFTAKQVLEAAVFLLGASIDLPLLLRAGPALAASIVILVVLGILASFAIGRSLGLPHKLAILVACGNGICGNSAIAAIAPVIHAEREHVASSIAFTAILGVIVVVGLPFLVGPLHLSFYQYGVLAGLTVYAVPQVLAATVPAGLVSTQIGTLVKLMRVLMLGPIVIGLSLLAPRLQGGLCSSKKVGFFRLVPWFIIGFLALAALRSIDIVPAALIGPLTAITGFLTVVSMAALGLGVDVRVLASVGGRVTAAVTLSLMLLLAISIGLIHQFN